MMRLYLPLFLFFTCLLHGQLQKETVLDLHKIGQIDSIKKLEFDFTNDERILLDWRIDFLKNFDTKKKRFLEITNYKIDEQATVFAKFLYYVNRGDFFFYKANNEIITANGEYLKALEIAKEDGNQILICDVIKKILELNKHSFLIENGSSKYYLAVYKENIYDGHEQAFWNYYKLLLEFQYYKSDKWDVKAEEIIIDYAHSSNNYFLSGKIFHLISFFHASNSNLEKAINYNLKATEQFEKIKHEYKSTQQRNSKIALLRLYTLNKDFDLAYTLIKELKTGSSNQLEKENDRYLYYYEALYNEYQNNYKMAFENLIIYLEETELNFIKDNRELSHELDKKYQTAEKEKLILIQQQRATTNRNWLIAASLLLIFGASMAILLQKNTTKKRKLAEQEALIEQQKVETLLKEQELVSLDAMIAGQEKERTKVANELHDDLGSLMATVKLHFDNVKVDEKDPAMKNAQDLLEKAYQKIRGMAHAKNSGVMANQGLLPAVEKMARTINETNALEVTVEDFGLADRMENSLELTIFRILQELVANIIKHAQATKASIQFTQHEYSMNIIVEDNGKGFDMSAAKRKASGMGLGTIEKRIEHLEGSFTVDSVLGKGTSILIDIPV